MRWRHLSTVLLLLVLVGIPAGPVLAQSSAFGISVAIDDDALIIGEPNNNFRPGTVYVYRKSGDAWQEEAQLRAPDAERADGFGAVLALAGDTLIVAQRGGQLFTFERDGASWRSTGRLPVEGMPELQAECGNNYGYCDTDFGIALAASGDWLLVGTPGREEGRGGRGGEDPEPALPGIVFAFQRGADGTWAQRGRLEPDEGIVPGDGFGTSVAMLGDRALVGAPNRDSVAEREGGGRRGGRRGGPSEPATPVEGVGRVFEFRLEDGAWQPVTSFGSENGRDAAFGAAITVRDDVAVIGAPGSGDGHGAAFIYRRDAETGDWQEASRLSAFSGVRGDRFGSAVAIDGDDIWVGAPAPRGTDTGITYLFPGAAAAAGDEMIAAPERFRLTDTVTRDAFGDRITAANGIAAVTSTGMHHQAGAVYVYERASGGDWQGGQMLISEPDAMEPLVGEVRECTDGSIGPFDCDGIDLLAFVPGPMLRAPGEGRGVRTNDNWGWTDPVTGREYAFIGRNDGTSFFDITDPVNPVLLGDLPKTEDTPPSQLWRDIKYYQDHAFIVADGAGDHGMQVFDLSRLRDVPNMPVTFEPDAHYDLVGSVHNIVINRDSGFAYLVGSDGAESCGGGLHMVDIRDPLNPQFAGCHRDERGTHDAQCLIYQGPDEDYQGHELCLMANGDFLSIADVTDKENPVVVGRGTYPNPAYLHQGWVTPDHRYFIMDDESDVIRGFAETTRTTIWDLTEVDDPLLVTEFMGSTDASAHNLYVKGNLVYQANYRYGLHILDIADPENPVEAGSFDTAPYLEGPGFSGAWSNYPFFDSGTIIVTSLQEGMFLLRKQEE